MTENQPKYVSVGWKIWPENLAYVRQVAAARNWPLNEAVRRILSDAETRRLFLPSSVIPDTLSGEKE